MKSGSQLRPNAVIKLDTDGPGRFAVTPLMCLQLFLIQCAAVRTGRPPQNARVDDRHITLSRDKVQNRVLKCPAISHFP